MSNINTSAIVCSFCWTQGKMSAKAIRRKRPGSIKSAFTRTTLPVGVATDRKHDRFTQLNCGHCGMVQRIPQ